MSSVNDFVNGLTQRDAERHALDLADLINDLDPTRKERVFEIFLENLTITSYETLENEMDVVI